MDKEVETIHEIDMFIIDDLDFRYIKIKYDLIIIDITPIQFSSISLPHS